MIRRKIKFKLLLIASLITSGLLFNHVKSLSSMPYPGIEKFYYEINQILYGASPSWAGVGAFPIDPKEVNRIFENIIKDYAKDLGLEAFEREEYSWDENSDPLHIILKIKGEEGKDIGSQNTQDVMVTYLEIYKIDHNIIYPEEPKTTWLGGIDPDIFVFEENNAEEFTTKLQESIRKQLDHKLLYLFCRKDEFEICKSNYRNKFKAK